jgi:hypothetical protein
MVLTAHYMVHNENGWLALWSQLLAFQIVEGKHNSKNLAKIIFKILHTFQHILTLLKGPAVSDHFTFLRGLADLGPDILVS